MEMFLAVEKVLAVLANPAADLALAKLPVRRRDRSLGYLGLSHLLAHGGSQGAGQGK